MRKPDTDPNNVRMSDVLCDFCRAEWTETLPMVEGHQGACICGKCLTAAYTEIGGSLAERDDEGSAAGIAVALGGKAGPATKCTMCLEERPPPVWKSPATGAVVCRRCARLAAGALEKDEEFGWTRPGR